MNRSVALTVGVCLLLVAGLVAGTGAARAGEKDDVKKIERTIKIVGRGGGGVLGVGLEEVEGDARGARVTRVRSGSAADEAGLQKDDVITSFDGEGVRSARQLRRLVGETPSGRTVALEVRRGGATVPIQLTATLGEGSRWSHHGEHTAEAIQLGEGVFTPGGEDFDIEISDPLHTPGGSGPHVMRWFGDGDHDFTMHLGGRPRLGIRFIELGDQLAEYFDLSSGDGVLVTSVEKGSAAEDGGLRAGDLLLQIDGKPIRGGTELRRAVRKADAGAALQFSLRRKGRSMELEVTLPEPEPRKGRRAAGVSL